MIDFNATIIAQVLNFLFLVFILAKFAYKPVINMMEDRKNKIASDLENAELAKAEAEKLKAEYAAQLATVRQEAQSIIDSARKTAQSVHDKIIAETKAEQEQTEAEAVLKATFQDLQESLNTLSKSVLHTTENVIRSNLSLLEKSIEEDCAAVKGLLNRQYRRVLCWSLAILVLTGLALAGIIGLVHIQMNILKAEIQDLKEQKEQTEAEYIKVWNRFKGLESYPYQGENYLLTPQNWQITLYGTKGKQNVWKISKD